MMRADGLAACTTKSASTTSTPSARVSITRLLTSDCMRASVRLRRAICCSRARRSDRLLVSHASASSPTPVKPACTASAVPAHSDARAPITASPSRSRAANAAVPSARARVPRIAAISTGKATSGA